MTKDLKDRVMVALEEYQDKQKKTGRKAIDVVTMTITGNSNVQASGDVNINTRKIERAVIQPGPEHITEECAFKLSELVKKAVEIECVAGADMAKCFQKWWSKVKRRYRVTSYKMIPSDLSADAILYMQQEVAKLRPKLRRRDNEAWRTEHYKGIWARSKQLGHNKVWVYALVEEKIGKKVESLKALGEQELKKLYTIIMGK